MASTHPQPYPQPALSRPWRFLIVVALVCTSWLLWVIFDAAYQRVSFETNGMGAVYSPSPLPESVSIARGDGVTLQVIFSPMAVHHFAVEGKSGIREYTDRYGIILKGSGRVWRWPFAHTDTTRWDDSKAMATEYVEEVMGLPVYDTLDLISAEWQPPSK